LPWNGGFNDTAGIAFSGQQNDKNHSSEAMYSSAKCFMILEESRCQATKTPNTGFVDIRYLWVEDLMTIEDPIFRPPKY
jgi:hypothetical protein